MTKWELIGSVLGRPQETPVSSSDVVILEKVRSQLSYETMHDHVM